MQPSSVSSGIPSAPMLTEAHCVAAKAIVAKAFDHIYHRDTHLLDLNPFESIEIAVALIYCNERTCGERHKNCSCSCCTSYQFEGCTGSAIASALSFDIAYRYSPTCRRYKPDPVVATAQHPQAPPWPRVPGQPLCAHNASFNSPAGQQCQSART